MRLSIPSLAAVFSASALVNLCNAVLLTVLPIYLAAATEDQESTAFLASAYSGGFLVGCVYGPRFISVVGHTRSFASGASVFAITLLAFTWFVNVPAWICFRLITGFALAIMLSSTDSWINASTKDSNRGQVLAAYAILLSLASISSQYLVYAFDQSRLMLALVLCAVVNFAIVLLASSRSVAPSIPEYQPLNVRAFKNEHPSAFFGCLVGGMLATSALSIVPHYLSQFSVSATMIGLSVGAIYCGRLLLQWPLGKASDVVDRRHILFAAAMMAALISVAAWIFSPGQGRAISGESGEAARWLAIVCLALWGGFALSLYSLSVAYALDHAEDEQVIGVTSLSLLVFAFGGIIGPIMCAGSAALFGPGALPITLAAFALGYALLLRYRLRVEPVRQKEREIQFSDVPATSTSVSEVVVDAEERDPDTRLAR